MGTDYTVKERKNDFITDMAKWIALTIYEEEKIKKGGRCKQMKRKYAIRRFIAKFIAIALLAFAFDAMFIYALVK